MEIAPRADFSLLSEETCLITTPFLVTCLETLLSKSQSNALKNVKLTAVASHLITWKLQTRTTVSWISEENYNTKSNALRPKENYQYYDLIIDYNIKVRTFVVIDEKY